MSQESSTEEVVLVKVSEADTSVICSEFREQLATKRKKLSPQQQTRLDKGLIAACCDKDGDVAPWLEKGADPFSIRITDKKRNVTHFAFSLAAAFNNTKAVINLLEAGIGEILPIDANEKDEVRWNRDRRLNILNNALNQAAINNAEEVMGVLLFHIITFVPEEFWPKMPNFGPNVDMQAAMLGATQTTAFLSPSPRFVNPNKDMASLMVRKALKAALKI